MDEQAALRDAIEAGRQSPCAKSKRGVVIFRRTGRDILGTGFNAPPPGFTCDGSETCRAACSNVAVHAEQAALIDAHRHRRPLGGAEMIHIKIVDGQPVAGGGPSCPDCSKLILQAGLGIVWLLEAREGHPNGVWVRRTPEDFHNETLRNCGLHPFAKVTS